MIYAKDTPFFSVVKACAAVVVFFAAVSAGYPLSVMEDHTVSTSRSIDLSSSACARTCGNGITSNFNDTASHRYLIVDLSEGCSASRYPVAWRDYDPHNGWSDEYKTGKLVLRRIKPGTFVIGEEKTNECFRVTFTRPFFIGVFEVTQRQWELVMGTRPSDFKDNYEKRPVENVSYDMIRGKKLGAMWPKSDDVDVDSFLWKLRKRTGLNFDLPTEAQWEYACSAGRETEYSYGSVPDGRYMWHHDNSGRQTHDVGLKLPNRWGLFDMHGNVSEWCLNRSAPSLYGSDIDPIGFPIGSCRKKLGGSWFDDAGSCKTYSRRGSNPSSGTMFTGFRLLLCL